MAVTSNAGLIGWRRLGLPTSDVRAGPGARWRPRSRHDEDHDHVSDHDHDHDDDQDHVSDHDHDEDHDHGEEDEIAGSNLESPVFRRVHNHHEGLSR